MKVDLSEKKFLVGIDPGFNNLGICIYDPETNEMKMFGGDWFDGIEWLGQNIKLNRCVIVLENPALDSAVFKALGMVKPIITLFGNYMKKLGAKAWPLPNKTDWPMIASELSKAFTTAQRIGENKAAGKLMLKLLNRHKVVTIQIAPSNRIRADRAKVPVGAMVQPTKTNKFQFQTLTGFTGRSNEHGRDAATLVWGKSFRWAENMLLIEVEDKAAKTRKKSIEKRKANPPQEVSKKERKFFNVHDPANPGQRVEMIDGKFKFVE